MEAAQNHTVTAGVKQCRHKALVAAGVGKWVEAHHADALDHPCPGSFCGVHSLTEDVDAPDQRIKRVESRGVDRD
jgi:hypothetical protein